MNAVVSLPELPDNDDTVRLLPLLLDPDKVDTLDLDETPVSDPDPDPDLDPADPADRVGRLCRASRFGRALRSGGNAGQV